MKRLPISTDIANVRRQLKQLDMRLKRLENEALAKENPFYKNGLMYVHFRGQRMTYRLFLVKMGWKASYINRYRRVGRTAEILRKLFKGSGLPVIPGEAEDMAYQIDAAYAAKAEAGKG